MQRQSRWAYLVVGVAVIGLLAAESERAGLDARYSPDASVASGQPSSAQPALGEAVITTDAGARPLTTERVTTEPEPAITARSRPGQFVLAASGDILPHSTLLKRLVRTKRSMDIDGSFEEVRGMLSRADLAVCHIEGAMLRDGEPIRPSDILGTPPVWLREVKRAGFDTCSTASNHSLDGGAGGVDATVGAFDTYGLHQAGVAASADTVMPKLLRINGVRVAHLSYTYGLDKGVLPPGQPWRANLINTTRIIADAVAARAAGAEAVVVSMHWGNTQWVKPSPEQLRVADALTKSGQIDLIVGTHTHLIQPISKVNGVWVLWGLGDFLTNHPVNPHWQPATQDGVIVEVPFRRTSGHRVVVGTPVAHPTWCDKDHGYRVRLAAPGERAADLPAATRRALDQSYARTAAVLKGFVVPR